MKMDDGWEGGMRVKDGKGKWEREREKKDVGGIE
jgi:hypothetical protein